MRSVNDSKETVKNSTDPTSTAEASKGVTEATVAVEMTAAMAAAPPELLSAPRTLMFVPSNVPPFGVLSDGRVIMRTQDLGDIDLEGRELFTGVVLTVAELSDAQERMANLLEDVAAFTAGWIRKQAKKRGGGNS